MHYIQIKTGLFNIILFFEYKFFSNKTKANLSTSEKIFSQPQNPVNQLNLGLKTGVSL